MMNSIQFVKTLNRTQKLVVGIAASTCISIMVVHNPFSGYVIQSEFGRYVQVPLPVCTIDEKENYEQFLSGFFSRIENHAGYEYFIKEAGGVEEFVKAKAARCHALAAGLQTDSAFNSEYVVTVTDHAFNQWRTKNPMMIWFGSVVNSLFSIFACILICFIFVGFVFSDRAEK